MNLDDLKKFSGSQADFSAQPESMVDTIRKAEQEAKKGWLRAAGSEFARQESVGDLLALENASADRLVRDVALGRESSSQKRQNKASATLSRINVIADGQPPDLMKPFRDQRAREEEQLDLTRRQVTASEKVLEVALAEADSAKQREAEEKARRVEAEKRQARAESQMRMSLWWAFGSFAIAAWALLKDKL